ncbi:MAG TPA: pyridoxal phosphate-dependent aminotransferase [Solirubrobacteraceae bacterium]|nr:pyridoxal phosphate-dependent aminotransferase [Solirubrobacteraceae bacterium]
MRQFPASPITALIDEKPLYNLGESVAPDLTVAELLGSAGPADLADVKLGYGTSAGSAELRALVAGRHGIADSQVLITTGAAAALFLVALLVGDGEIVIGRPCYPPAFDAVQGLGARAVTVASLFEDGYRIDLDAFAAKLSSRTRLVSVASPQNPSGVAFRQDEIEWMLAAMSRTCPEALLLIDETYREATYGGAVPAASFAGTSPRVLTCGSLSKAHGAPGLRIGWLTASDAALAEELRLAKFNSSLACGTLDELLAARLLARADQVLAERGAFLAQAREIVERWIKGHAGRLHWLPPEAGAMCCVQLDPGAFGPQDVDRFHAYLGRERTLVARGPWFGDTGHVFRLGLGYEPLDRLEQGLGIISAALAA